MEGVALIMKRAYGMITCRTHMLHTLVAKSLHKFFLSGLLLRSLSFSGLSVFRILHPALV